MEFTTTGSLQEFVLNSLNGTFVDTTITIGEDPGVGTLTFDLGEGNDSIALSELEFLLLGSELGELSVLGNLGDDSIIFDSITASNKFSAKGGGGIDTVAVTGIVVTFPGEFNVDAEFFDSFGHELAAESIDISAMRNVSLG